MKKSKLCTESAISIYSDIFHLFFFCNVLVLNEMPKLFKLYFVFSNKITHLLIIVVRFEMCYFQ